jgi:hypothetical protein
VAKDMNAGAARDEFARLTLEAAVVQAVAYVEGVICTAWTHHLNGLVDTTEAEVGVAQRAHREAQDLVRAVQACGDPGTLRTARGVLETAEAKEHHVTAKARHLLSAIQGEVETVEAAEHAREEAVRRSESRIAALRARRGPGTR